MVVERLRELPFTLEIYVVPDARQRDFFSCPIFSMGDLREALNVMSREGESFFSYFEKHASLKMAEGIQRAYSLPIGMLYQSAKIKLHF